jgi:hypothetical protein
LPECFVEEVPEAADVNEKFISLASRLAPRRRVGSEVGQTVTRFSAPTLRASRMRFFATLRARPGSV